MKRNNHKLKSYCNFKKSLIIITFFYNRIQNAIRIAKKGLAIEYPVRLSIKLTGFYNDFLFSANGQKLAKKFFRVP